MSEPDPIPVGLEQLLAYRRKRVMDELNQEMHKLRAVMQANQALTSQEAVRRMADVMTAELGQRVNRRRSSMPGSGAA